MEIERKFLMSNFPYLDSAKSVTVFQGYLSFDPEVRIRSYGCGDHKDYTLTVKGDGDLQREEVEFYIYEEKFERISAVIGKPLIHKHYRRYKLPDGLTLECSHVDVGLESEFMYAEIEFESIEQANSYQPPVYLGREVTYDPEFKMKNYWNRTRQ